MPANLENSAMATELKKVSFHSNSKERQCQRMLKLPHNCTHLTRCCCEVASVVFNSMRLRRWQPTSLPRPWDSLGKNTGVGCHSLLQEVFLTQGSNPCLLHCWLDSLLAKFGPCKRSLSLQFRTIQKGHPSSDLMELVKS